MNILQNLLPLLRVARAAAAGNPVPGLEGAITGVVELAEMVSTMRGNKADLPDAELKQRLDTLKQNLESIITRLTSLEEKSRIKQFLKAKKYEKEIQDIKTSIASHIQDFTFHNSISIKILVDQMSTQVHRVDTAVQRIEPQGIECEFP
ncbi:hypothetical protein B0H12DRAFT_156801 [Mycena haematopus]|nr:hypothetical protein B0H12DRAFT_156801 [Mycena haematopus]